MKRFIASGLYGVIALSLFASSVLALQGVVEQEVTLPCPNQPNWGSTVVELEEDALDAKALYDSVEAKHGVPQVTSKVTWNSYMDAQEYGGEADVEVKVYEELSGGNHSGGDGLKSAKSLADTQDVDVVSVNYSPLDNPYGRVSVELIQKTYNTISIEFDRNDADNQSKYFYFRIANTLIDGTLQETTFQWSDSTTTATTSGVGVEFSVDGAVQGSASWSTTVQQGVDAFQHLVASRVHSVTEVVEFQAEPSMQQQIWEVTFDGGFQWNISTVDNNDFEVYLDASVLQGEATYNNVIGFGELIILKNHDGTGYGCPEVYHDLTDTGNPELIDDRQVQATVSYVQP